jgi:O-acetylserine/cysteine efflux transporter
MAPLGPILLTLAAAVAWALANIEVKRAGPLDALAFTVWMSLVPPLPMLALSLIFEGPAAIATAVASVDALSIAAVLYLAYPISVLSVAMWAGLLARNPAAAVTPFILMVPPIGMVTGWATFGETLGPGTLAGCVLVAAGLVVAVIGGRNLLK